MFFLLLLALCGCSGDEDSISGRVQQAGEALQIKISAGDFITDGTPDTRAIDKGVATTFEDGDKVGVIVLGNGQLLADNIPYIYNGSQWGFDTSTADSEGSGKQQCYYSKKADTYIVYYPYSKAADGVTNENDLKGRFIPKENQRSEEAYRSSDLMLWTSSPDQPLVTLDAKLKHAYASVSFFPAKKYQLADGSDFFYVPAGFSDVSFTIGENVYSANETYNGFRSILPADFTGGNVRCFYTLDGTIKGMTLNITKAIANTRYICTQQIEDLGTYGLEDAHVGDFYCMNSSNEGYLIPADVISLDASISIIGIVYWVNSQAINDDALLKENHSECTHGLVVGLHEFRGKDDKGMYWSNSWESIRNNWINKEGNPYKGKVNTYEQNKLCGYSNTVVMTDYNTGGEDTYPSNVRTNDGLLVQPCVAINEYAKTHTVPTASSGWYFPSIYELKYMCWGQGNEQGVVGRDLLNRQIGKVSSKLDASPFSSSSYWSATEDYGYDHGSHAWVVYFGGGGTDRNYKSNNSSLLRPSLAF